MGGQMPDDGVRPAEEVPAECPNSPTKQHTKCGRYCAYSGEVVNSGNAVIPGCGQRHSASKAHGHIYCMDCGKKL